MKDAELIEQIIRSRVPEARVKVAEGPGYSSAEIWVEVAFRQHGAIALPAALHVPGRPLREQIIECDLRKFFVDRLEREAQAAFLPMLTEQHAAIEAERDRAIVERDTARGEAMQLASKVATLERVVDALAGAQSAEGVGR
jgi:hypothetical protein